MCAHPPHRRAGDRGTAAAATERPARKLGVKQVVLPKPGAKAQARHAYERRAGFRRGRRWRAGIEGRSSGLQRGQGLARWRDQGDDGLERWVGWGVIAHDLRMLARKRAP